jgi:hypothetical protein
MRRWLRHKVAGVKYAYDAMIRGNTIMPELLWVSKCLFCITMCNGLNTAAYDFAQASARESAAAAIGTTTIPDDSGIGTGLARP